MSNLINTKIKPFKATAYKGGEFKEVTEQSLLGKWSVVFFYPADFTFVCPTELGDLADHYPQLKDMGSLEFSKQLLTHAEVAVAPGVGYGEDGEGFVRIAMVENEQRLRQAARNIKRYLSSMGINSSAA